MRLTKLIIASSCFVALVACAPISNQASQITQTLQCTPVQPNDPLVGNWLSVNSQKGVAGALRTLYTLNADGTMTFNQQIKRNQNPSQGIYESGCWSRNGEILVLRTGESNGLPVNLEDPIYTDKFKIIGLNSTELKLQGDTGSLEAKRMSPGYRLPF